MHDVGVTFALSQLQANLARHEERLSEHMQATAAHGAMLQGVSGKVENLIKTVSTGNGQPALLVQVSDLKNDVRTIKSTLESMDESVDDVRDSLKDLSHEVKSLASRLDEKYTPAQKAERWKAWGVIAASAVSLVTALSAFLGVHL